jgi:hypothetical protein
MYVIQWKDNQSGKWLLCSTKGQMEVYDSFDRAMESLEVWRKGAFEEDEYRIVDCNIVVTENK